MWPNKLLGLLPLLVSLHASAAWEKLPYSRQLQGLCAADGARFIVQKKKLWKIGPTETIQVSIPAALKSLGANHLGDCDVHGQYVFVPVEGTSPLRIALFDKDDLSYINSLLLPATQKHAGWVTVDPQDGTVWSGEFNLQTVTKYEIDYENFVLKAKESFNLTESAPIPRAQSVEVDRLRHRIWVVSDVKDGGLLGFDLGTYAPVSQNKIAYQPPKEELEGLDADEHGVTISMWRTKLWGLMGRSKEVQFSDQELGL